MKHSSNIVSSFKSSLSIANDSWSDSKWNGVNGIHFKILKKCVPLLLSFRLRWITKTNTVIIQSGSQELINNRLGEHYYRLVFVIFRLPVE